MSARERTFLVKTIAMVPRIKVTADGVVSHAGVGLREMVDMAAGDLFCVAGIRAPVTTIRAPGGPVADPSIDPRAIRGLPTHNST